MTVDDLIAELLQQDKNARVVIREVIEGPWDFLLGRIVVRPNGDVALEAE